MDALRALPQWVCWDYVWEPNENKPEGGDWTKPPLNPRTGYNGSATNPDVWTDYETAARGVLHHRLAGVGFALSPDDGFTGIDLDHCRNKETGELEPWAAEIVALKETYVEVSPSGEGLRLICRGKVDKAIKCDPAQVEIYGTGRYLTITGQQLPGTPDRIQPAPKTLEALQRRVAEMKAAAEAEKAAEKAQEQANARQHGAHDFSSAQRQSSRSDGSPFFRNVNERALAALDLWVPALFGPAAVYQLGTRGYRISSRALGRDLEEDLSISPQGIVDFGVHDMGDPRDGKRTPIDLVMEYGNEPDAKAAAFRLCERLGLSLEELGWRASRPSAAPPDGGEDDELARLNEKYCVVRDGGKTRVLTFDPRVEKDHRRLVATLLSFEDFRNFYMNQMVRVGKRDVPLGKWWLEHPERRQYRGMTFQPGGAKEVDGYLNLWIGWGIEPKPGDWSLLRRHLEEVLAAGDKTAAEYIIKWVAWAFQNPAERAQAAIVFRGKKGTGKGTLGNALCRIFGQHGTHISSAEHLAGRFNAHLRDACLLFADEAYWPGDKGAEGSLKRLVTEPDLFIEGKGRDGVTVPNMLHVMMASNEDWVVPAGEDERRYAIFEVSDRYKQDETWFRPLYAEMENGGLAAMLHDLLRMDLGDWHPRRIPKTSGLLHQQARGLSPEDDWWVSLLEAGTLPASDRNNPDRAVSGEYVKTDPYDPSKETRCSGLYQHARTASPRLKGRSDTALGLYLKTQGCRSRRVMRHRGWEFPPLSQARAAWERRFPGWVWHSPNLTEWGSDED
jgi:hypothetical protein